MEKGGDVKGVFDRLARGIQAGGQILTRILRDSALDQQYFVFLGPTRSQYAVMFVVYYDLQRNNFFKFLIFKFKKSLL